MQEQRGGFFQLTPFLIFVGLFLISVIWFESKISPLFSCLIAIIFSLFTFSPKVPFNRKIEVFIEGGANTTIISMCFIFIFSSVFTHVLKSIGSIDSAVKLGLFLLPAHYMLPGLFLIIALFATAIGSSMGTIAAFLPIGIGLAETADIPFALIAGIVVSATMLGDNLSIISDTTIAATQTTGSTMTDKFKANIRLVLPAALITLVILTYLNTHFTIESTILTKTFTSLDILLILPYLLILFFALMGIDVIAVLILGTFIGIGIGIFLGYFSFIESTSFLLEGFSKDRSIHEVLILSLLIAGLSKIVEYNGGLSYLLNKLRSRVTSKGGAEIAIVLLIFLINAVIAINTIAILIAGPIARQIATKFGIANKRTACLLDIFSCICQGILPYAPQLLLARSLAHVSSISIIPYLYYQGLIFIITTFSIGRTFWKKEER